MFRSASGKAVQNTKRFAVRRFSNSLQILKDEGIIVRPHSQVGQAKDIKKKKGFSFTKFLIQATLASSIAYGGTLYAATKNEKVMDFVIDNQLPYYEELLDVLEADSLEELKNKLQKKTKNFSFTKENLEEFTQKLEHRGEDLINETRKKFGGGETPAEQLQKPVEIESVKKDIEHLPLIQLSTSIVDSSLKKTVESFNSLIKSIEVSKTPANASLIKEINDNVSNLSAKIDSLTKSFEAELNSKLKDAQTELLSSFTKKELDMTENLLYQFNNEKAQLEKRLSQTLNREIAATKETISQAAVNAVSMVRIEQTKQFEKLIKSLIDKERNGRLANLEALNSRIEELEAFASNLETQVIANHQKSLVQKALGNLRSLFNTNETEKPMLVAPYIEELTSVSSVTKDELITLALQDLKPLLAKDSNKSILSTAQLLSRWEELTPELRSASLLPPNAGLLGHLSSMLFSAFLLPVKGVKPDGKDIESVIGKVEASLSRGELDVAVEEVTNLKGWPRKLANDWVVEGRKRLEMEFLLSVIEAESKLL